MAGFLYASLSSLLAKLSLSAAGQRVKAIFSISKSRLKENPVLKLLLIIPGGVDTEEACVGTQK